MQLFPILLYGLGLGENVGSENIKYSFRREIRRGLGMRRSESICDHFEDLLMEAVERIRTIQLSFLNRAQNSVNSIVSGLRMLPIPYCTLVL